VNTKGGKISGYIRGSSWVGAFLFHVDDWDWSLRGNPGNPTIDKFVQHQIPHDKNSESLEAPKSRTEQVWGDAKLCVGRHRETMPKHTAVINATLSIALSEHA
jgi:hypothetical protein